MTEREKELMSTYSEQLLAELEEHLESLQVHSPCFFLPQQEWERLADKLEDPFFAELHQNNLKAIDALENSYANSDITDMPAWLDITDKTRAERAASKTRLLKARICRGVAAWYVTDEEKYFDFCIQTMDACCTSDQWFCDAGDRGLHGADLHTGDLLFTLSFAVDALWQHLDQQQRTRYLDCLLEKGIAAYLKGVREKDWWVTNLYNWNPSLHANAALAALLLMNHHQETARQVLRHAFRGLGLHLAIYCSGGGYTEGPMYQATAIGHLSDFAIAWNNLTGDDLGLSQHQAFKETLRIWNYLVGGDGRVLNFSNCSEFGCQYGLTQVFWWARHLTMPEIHDHQMRFLEPWQDVCGLFHDVECFWHRKAYQQGGDIDVSGLHHFSGIDWATYHGKKLWLGFTAGLFGEAHSNAHQGHFILGYGDERFLCDPGYGATSSEKHNSVTIGGQSIVLNSFLPITRIEELQNGFYLCCNMKPGWPSSLAYYQRHLLMLDESCVLVIDDGEGMTRPLPDGSRNQNFFAGHWHWQTRLPCQIHNDRVILHGRENNLTIMPLERINTFEERHWEHDGPISTIHWREYANEYRTVFPTLLDFGNTICKYEHSDTSCNFKINGTDYHFVNGDEGLIFST